MSEKDFLDEQIAERTAKNPDYARLLDAAEGHRAQERGAVDMSLPEEVALPTA